MNENEQDLAALQLSRDEEEPSRRGGWRILVGVGMLVLLVGMIALYVGTRPVGVTTRLAQEPLSGSQTVLNASGYIVARRAATVSSKVTGKVIEVLIEEGMRVENNQILARLDDANATAQFKLAEAQRAAAQSALGETEALVVEATREWTRVQALAGEQIASDAEVDQARARVDSLRARLIRLQDEVVVAERQVAVLRQHLEDLVIRAPFSGIAVSKNAQPGEMISPVSAGGGFTRTGIGTIVDMESLEIEVDVNESYIHRVHADQTVEATLDAYPDWKMPSHVIAIIPTADRQKSTVKVRIGIDQLDPRILPEMGVKVAFREPIETSQNAIGVTVPEAALREREGTNIVVVVDGNRAEVRSVTVGERRDGEVTLSSGLTVGERVVVEGPEDLDTGRRVKERKR